MSVGFLQSPEWEEFQKSIGRKTWRVDGTLLIKHELPLKFNYLYCPRPELVDKNWLQEVSEIARGEKSIFLKIDPAQGQRMVDYGLRIKPSKSIQPRKTVILSLQKSEEELLRDMHEKTRYNVKLAERKGVYVSSTTEPTSTDMWIFWNLLEMTRRRDGFSPHPRTYYEKLLQVRTSDFSNELFLADHQMTSVAGAIINFYRPTQTATYLHGASNYHYRSVMAPYILHWRIMQEAKRRGFKYYDLWGVDEKKWPGVTRFKLGFGGEVLEYPESLDIIYRQFWYNIYKISSLIL